jgi:hypothetical protein
MNGRMKKISFALVALLVMVAACVPSVNPFYTSKDVVTDSRFGGTWLEDGDDTNNPASWVFEVTTNNAYDVTFKENKDKSGKFEGHLFKLGENLFLDLTPTECDYATNQAGLVGVAMIPGHLLVRVTFEDKKLNLSFCDPDWTKTFLQKNPSAIAHRMVDDSVILSADTPALQKFVQKHLGKDELFAKGALYRRTE